MSFGAGVYYNTFIKNLEILEIRKQNFLEVQNLSREIDQLKLKNTELKIKITGYEKEK